MSLIRLDYSPVKNNPGARNYKKNVKIPYSNNNNSRNENPVGINLVNGFCFGCTSKTFSNNMYNEKHYFNPYFSFESSETEFQLRLFKLKPSSTPLIPA